MKNLIKKLSLILVVMMVLSISFGCTPKDKPGVEEKISMASGFLNEINTEDGKNYISISTDEKSLKLEIPDKQLADSLTINEYYMVAFNENNIVKSIETNDFIKDAVNEHIGKDSFEIKSAEKWDTKELTLLDSYTIDFDKDGTDETISIYTTAQKDEKGNIAWDDGQNWTLLVEDTDKDYILFNDYVQLGNIQFYVYTVEDEFYISTIQTGTANLKLTEYKFIKDENQFIGTSKFETTGDANILHFPSVY
ncbi:hypothetical protein [Tissierella praeacuta]|uniref:hypothetical protein n=1 Tax=Tissierella praeacuta TaxID=43131 RepID=UPI0033422755